MTVGAAYLALMVTGICFMLLQLFVKDKKLVHLLFAVFCGSMAMVAAQQLSVNTLGRYHYLLGLGACVTCNGMWLVSKAMFSGAKSITRTHWVVALIISLLIVINVLIDMAFAFSVFENNTYLRIANGLGELINLLSSTVLALTFWEAFNGLKKKAKHDYGQRILFISSFCFGLILCTVVAQVAFAPRVLPEVYPWLMTVSAIQIMVVVQVIMWWRQYNQLHNAEDTNAEAHEIDENLIAGINLLLKENKGYLTQNLKMIDLANQLNVSEYKVSRAIRHHFNAPNFNHFINSLRIEHAKRLLAEPESKEWPILVVAMESGFSSLATFNRVFKAQLGYAPKQHRKQSI